MKTTDDAQGAAEEFQAFVFEMDDVLDAFISSARSENFELNYSLGSLNQLEAYIDSRGDSRDDWNFINRAARYLGEVFRKNVGGIWTLSLDDPKNINYRLPIIANYSDLDMEFCPLAIVRNYVIRRKRGLLDDAVQSNKEFARPKS